MPTADSRIPNQLLVSNSLSDLQSVFAKLADLQEQAATLKRLRKPSDAPADVVSAMHLRAGLDRNTQFSTNIADASAWLGTADTALTSGFAQLQRVNDLVVQAANASTDANARAGIASEIDTIRTTLIGVANTQYAGRPVFGGTASGDAAYDSNGNYVGVSAAVERNIGPGQRVQVNVNGDAVFGTPGNDLFTTLAQISAAVRTNPANLTALQATLTTRTSQVQNQLAEVGARFRRVDGMKSQNSSDDLTMKKNLSSIEDADIAQVMMQLQSQQLAYQAALAATAKAIQPSLTDFLR